MEKRKIAYNVKIKNYQTIKFLFFHDMFLRLHAFERTIIYFFNIFH